MKISSMLLLTLTLVFTGSAKNWVEKPIIYDLDGVRFESSILFDADENEPRPGILMIPNWMGPDTEGTLKKAKKIAGDDYIVMIVDMYGEDVRPKNGQEAGAAAGAVRANRGMMQARAAKALQMFREEKGNIPLQADNIAAIGFCFGGGAALELGRSGAELDAIVSFHGDLLSPTLEADAGKTRAKVLVLHGAADPYVPQQHVQTFVDAMLKTDVNWQLVQFSHAVHSFTDPSANSPGQAHYHPQTAKRAFEMMDDLFDEIWD